MSTWTRNNRSFFVIYPEDKGLLPYQRDAYKMYAAGLTTVLLKAYNTEVDARYYFDY